MKNFIVRNTDVAYFHKQLSEGNTYLLDENEPTVKKLVERGILVAFEPKKEDASKKEITQKNKKRKIK